MIKAVGDVKIITVDNLSQSENTTMTTNPTNLAWLSEAAVVK